MLKLAEAGHIPCTTFRHIYPVFLRKDFLVTPLRGKRSAQLREKSLDSFRTQCNNLLFSGRQLLPQDLPTKRRLTTVRGLRAASAESTSQSEYDRRCDCALAAADRTAESRPTTTSKANKFVDIVYGDS